MIAYGGNKRGRALSIAIVMTALAIVLMTGGAGALSNGGRGVQVMGMPHMIKKCL